MCPCQNSKEQEFLKEHLLPKEFDFYPSIEGKSVKQLVSAENLTEPEVADKA